MDLGNLIALMMSIAVGIATVIGTFLGVRSNKVQNSASVNQLLESRNHMLQQDIAVKDALIEELRKQVEMLTNLVTQKADVESVRKIVDEIKTLVEGIASANSGQA